MDEDRARYLDIEQMVKRELQDAEGFMWMAFYKMA